MTYLHCNVPYNPREKRLNKFTNFSSGADAFSGCSRNIFLSFAPLFFLLHKLKFWISFRGLKIKVESYRFIPVNVTLYFLFLFCLPTPCISESCIKIKINLNFYFYTSLWCLRRFYEGLSGRHETCVKIKI